MTRVSGCFDWLQGEEMNIGCVVDDYVVTIGTGVCTDLVLSANAVLCRPPKKPSKVNAIADSDGHHVDVSCLYCMEHHQGLTLCYLILPSVICCHLSSSCSLALTRVNSSSMICKLIAVNKVQTPLLPHHLSPA